jgi:hypothetical protein
MGEKTCWETSPREVSAYRRGAREILEFPSCLASYCCSCPMIVLRV